MSSQTASSQVDYIELQTGVDPVASVIWLHGLGADGHDFEAIVPVLNIPSSTPIRFIFPHAPIRPVTVNGGMEMRAWYDIKSMDFKDRGDRQEFEESAGIVHSLIEQENLRGIPADRIILAGFSQGGAIALFAGLRYPQRLAGIVALSTYLPFAESTDTERSEQNLSIPVFMAHGNFDPVIPIALAELSREKLSGLGYNIEWQTYQTVHSVHQQEIQDIADFLLSSLR